MRSRLVLGLGAGAALVVALVLVLTLTSGDDEAPEQPSAAPASAEQGETSSVSTEGASSETSAESDGLVQEVDGEVELRSSSSDGQDFDPSCINTIQREYACYEAYLVDVLDREGGEQALDELQRLADEEPFVLAECHPLTHSIGRAAYTKYGSYQAAVPEENGTCWSGYTHGVLERLIFNFTEDELGPALDGVCEQDPEQDYSFDYYNCVHGLGHGVSWRYDNGVFEALPLCDELTGSWEQKSCYSGVFMQNIIADGDYHTSRELRPEEPMYPCTAVDDQYKQTCYLMQTSYALRVVDYDYEEVFDLCDTVADDGYEDTCYRSMGRDISGNTHRNSEKVVELCSLGNPARQGQCYAGAVKNAVFNDSGVENANRLCELVPEQHRVTCEEARDQAASTL